MFVSHGRYYSKMPQLKTSASITFIAAAYLAESGVYLLRSTAHAIAITVEMYVYTSIICAVYKVETNKLSLSF